MQILAPAQSIPILYAIFCLTTIMMFIVNICVDNCSVRGTKPVDRFQNNPMPTNEKQKVIWWEYVNVDRLNPVG